MKSPDPENYARVVLWYLSSLRADVHEIKLRIAKLEAAQFGIPDKAEQKKLQKQIEDFRDQLYQEGLSDSRLHGLQGHAFGDPIDPNIE